MTIEALRFRVATEDDLNRILEIHSVAYPDPRSNQERRRNFTANRLGALEDFVICERAGEIVGQAFLFPLEAWFGGRPVRMGAIASLAVAPEARGAGIATALLGHLHRASDVRGDALTMLYPFRQGMYAKLGYGPTVSRRRLGFDPASVPAPWRALARAVVRRPRGEDGDGIRAVYARAAAKSSGWLTRSEATWDRHLARERRQFLVADRSVREAESSGRGVIAGYVAFELVQEEPHAPTTLIVEELAADDDASRLALLGALSAMRDQVMEIELEVDASDVLELALCDPDRRRFGNAIVEHDLGAIVGGPMVRVEDVPRAIEARGYAVDGAFDIVVHAEGESTSDSASDEIAVSIRVVAGRAEVSAARAAAGALRTTRWTLASLLYGGLRPTDAARIGLAEGDTRTLARADAILSMPPPCAVDPF